MSKALEQEYVFGVKVGVQKEQERIIALLERSIEQCLIPKGIVICQICDGTQEAIALIKGEANV